MLKTSFSSDELNKVIEGLDINVSGPQAVAVSGGADSLALVLLLNEVCEVEAVTVDHGLRDEAAEEALFVAGIMAKSGIAHSILKWQGDKPKTGIQAAARHARYDLIRQWCQRKSISNLFLGHHMDDQAETFLLRLSRGSGVYGLAAMAAKSPLMNSHGDINVIRPLLGVPKARLVAALQERQVRWIEDPSNQDLQYDRVKARDYLSGEPLLAIDAETLSKTASRMRRARQALDHYTDELLKDSVSLYPAGYAMLDARLLSAAPEEVGLRALSRLVRHISGADYGPRLEKLERAYDQLNDKDFKGQTLFGCQLSVSGDAILVTREFSSVVDNMESAEDLWDGRFMLAKTVPGEIKALGEEGWVQITQADTSIKNTDIPYRARLSLPTLWIEGRVIAQPHLGFGTGLKVKFSPNCSI